MIEKFGNLFEMIVESDAICIPTNGVVKRNGSAVMGAGVALACAKKWPSTQITLGRCLQSGPNIPYLIGSVDQEGNFYEVLNSNIKFCGIFSFPTKNHFKEKSDINLIKQSCQFMLKFADQLELKSIALPPVGCGLGGLNYEKEVKPLLSNLLDDRFVIVRN